MKNLLCLRLALAFVTLFQLSWSVEVWGEEAAYKPVLFKGLKLVYADTFDGGSFPTEFWEVRQNSTWTIGMEFCMGAQPPKSIKRKKLLRR